MSGKYGKSALSTTVSLPGFEKYLEKIESAGVNVDDACRKAVDAAAPIVYDAMKEKAEKHRKGIGKYGTDAVYNAIECGKATSTSNFISASVGIDIGKHPEAFHGVYIELGDGHSPAFPDPFVAPAFDENKQKVYKAERDVLKKEGVPID